MQLVRTRMLTTEQSVIIDRLWDAEYPVKLAGRFPLLLKGIDCFQHHLLLDSAGALAGWAVAFEKDDETRFSIIVPAAFQGKGYGALLLDSLKRDLDEFYGWVIDHDRDLRSDGTPYRSPLNFYRKHGFDVLGEQRIDVEILSAVKVRWKKHNKSCTSHGTGL